jgi:hypothetical protein
MNVPKLIIQAVMYFVMAVTTITGYMVLPDAINALRFGCSFKTVTSVVQSTASNSFYSFDDDRTLYSTQGYAVGDLVCVK